MALSQILSFLQEDHTQYYGAQLKETQFAPLRRMNVDGRNEFWASLALRHCSKIGIRTCARLLHYYGSAFTAIENRKEWQEARVKKECSLEFAREKWRPAAKKEWDEAANSEASILLWPSPLYPEKLRELKDPPTYLYCLGDLSLLQSPAVAIVGSRRASNYGLKTAFILAKDLSRRGISVISGMALGIDGSAHKAALSELGKSIGILGTGIDIIYPAQNKDIYLKMQEEGLLLSEFSPKLAPIGRNFPIRNRLISALSLGVLIVEAAERSGSLITAKYALEQNKEVFAVPNQALNNLSLGCKNLLRQGAHPVFCVDDILRELEGLLKDYKVPVQQKDSFPEIPDLPTEKSESKSKCQPSESPLILDFQGKEEVEKACQDEVGEQILQCLQNSSLHIEEIAEQLNVDMNEINSKLVFLELLGKIKRLPGARYEAI